MWLRGIDHAHHWRAISRATDVTDGVVFSTNSGITGVDDFRTAHGLETFIFAAVEKEALAFRATIHLDTLEDHDLH
jgi:hypothetical protein